jgi:hypothetical protein
MLSADVVVKAEMTHLTLQMGTGNGILVCFMLFVHIGVVVLYHVVKVRQDIIM